MRRATALLGREFLSRETIDDPFPLYADLRANQPVARIGPSGVHPVATWALIEEVLDREEDFSANLTGVLIRGDDGEATTFPLPPSGGSHVIATADEPDHRVHRSLVQPRMSPRRVEAMEALLRDWTGEAVATWSRAGGGDVIPIAETVPARAVAHLLGDRDEGRERRDEPGHAFLGALHRAADAQLVRVAVDAGARDERGAADHEAARYQQTNSLTRTTKDPLPSLQLRHAGQGQ